MNDEELFNKSKLYDDLNRQIKKLTDIKDKLKDEIKNEMKIREKEFINVNGVIITYSSYTRKFPNLKEIDKFIISNNGNPANFYNDKEISKLQISLIKRN